MNYKVGILFIILSLFADVNAQDGPVIVAVGEAQLQTIKIVIATPYFTTAKNDEKKSPFIKITKIIKNDFSFYHNEFSVIEMPYLKKINFNSKAVQDYKSKNIDFILVVSETYPTGKFDLYDIKNGKHAISKSFNGEIKNDYRSIAHSISDFTYKLITERNSIFKSHILFVSDRTGNKKNPSKEMYVMDFDGGQKKQLTWHRGTVISPAISRDGKQVLYSLIPRSLKNRNIKLMLLDMKTKKSRLLSNKKGINAGAVFLPGGKEIILTLSFQGNAELYVMDLKNLKTRRLTKNFAPDVDPSISFDGKRLTFLSGRSGKAMIYTMNPSGLEKNVKRISYVGKFNATPRFSPDGKQIVFSSWLDNKFDLFRLSANGKELYRLTKDFGSNEDPSFSPGGKFITFSSLRVISRRKADQNIYIMSDEGKVWGKITENYGNCITPRWFN